MEDEIELSSPEIMPEEGIGAEVGVETVEVADAVSWGFSVDASTTLAQALLGWYSNLPSQKLDLVAELGDSRGTFVLSGDSLITHVVRQYFPDGQFEQDKLFLSAIYYIERYIEIFLSAKRMGLPAEKASSFEGVKVVFFDCMRVRMSETETLLRELLVAHLEASTDMVLTFPDWLDAGFQRYVELSDIAAVIVSDDIGADASALASMDEESAVVQLMLVAMSVHLVTACRLRIAMLDQIESRGHRIVAFSIGPERRHELVEAKAASVFGSVFEQLKEAAQEEIGEPTGEGEGDRLAFLMRGVRGVIDELGRDSLSESPEAQLVVVMLRTIVLAASVAYVTTLAERAHVTLAPGDWSLFAPESEENYSEQIWAQLALETSLAIRRARQDGAKLSGLADLFDGRMLRTVTYVLWKNGCFSTSPSEAPRVLGISASSAETLESTWKQSGGFGSVFDLALSVELPAPSQSSEELFPAKTTSETSHMYALSAPFPLLERAKAVALSMGASDVVASLESGSTVAAPETRPQLVGSYIPETQLVTRRFEEKKKKDYEDQKLKWKYLSIDKLMSRMKTWELRGAQKELRAMHQYAKSLVGADSLHHPITLVHEPGRQKGGKRELAAPVVVAETDATEAETVAVGSTGAVKVSKKAQEIIARNVAAQQKNQASKDSDQIKPLIERAEAIADSRDWAQFSTGLLDICAGFSRVVDSFDGFKGVSASVKLEASQVKVIVAVIKSCRSVLKKLAPAATSHMASEAAKLGLRSGCAKIVRLCVSFVSEYAKEIEGKDIVRVQELLLSIGFSHVSKNLFAIWAKAHAGDAAVEEVAAKGDKGDKKDKKEKKDKKADKVEKVEKEKSSTDEFYVKSSKVEPIADVTGGDEYMFQLTHLSTELDRPSGTQADKRVMFKPDYWQKNLLDIVDKNESALVCAPTASGKTFICYYAMEKVLRSSNDKVAVYVAPSKALMNQVDAEIYARFRSKTYPATDHFHLSGDLEKDYQHNPFDCQVLVTVPGMLEQLLLDPTMQEWVARIQYVIFDEVHCMGESAEEAAIWEHALQLIPCPFLAMSATVGNPQKFHDWLNFVASIKSGPTVHLIEYKERYNDLQKYALPTSSAATDTIVPVHPFTLLSFGDLSAGVIPPDLTMTPAEAALLVATLRFALGPAGESSWKKLMPRKIFEKSIPIEAMVTKKLFRQYEAIVVAELVQMCSSGVIGRPQFEVIQASLARAPRTGDAKAANQVWSFITGTADKMTDAVDIVDGLKMVPETAHYLDAVWLNDFFRHMDGYALLPAIVFNLDRAEIMKMAQRLSEHLKQGQYEKYYGSEDRAYATRAVNKKRMDAYESQISRRRMMERLNKKDEDFDAAEVGDSIPPPVMVEDEFDPEYSFAGVKALSDPECHELIDKLAESKRVKPWIIEALRRGIGMHHEGCSTRLKKAVEVLFRRGFLRVVIATSTLSLGINMPCKSTVFVGTHVKLNALNYRQMAGRAGRRGFDLVGHVIFVDSTVKNIRRLLTSELTQLGGDFALTPSHVLRAQIMLDHIGADAEKGLKSRVEKNLMAMLMGGFMPFNAGASVHSLPILRSSIDFLIREGLLTGTGQVTKLGSLAAFLFKREPENMVVARVLLSRDLLGEVDRWLATERADQPTSMATFKLMQILSALCFTRPQLRGAALRTIPPRKRNFPSETCPVLPPVETLMPEPLRDIRQQFNKRVIDSVVMRLLLSLNESRSVQESDNAGIERLPASLTPVGTVGGSVNDRSAPLQQLLAAQRVERVQIRSACTALTGKGDVFQTKDELVMSSVRRPEMMLDHASVATVPIGQCSSYACDFMLHGKLSLLQNDCLIGVSESWKEIDEWRFFLESLNIALEFMFELDNTHEYAHLQKVVKDLNKELALKLQLEGA